MEWSIQEIARLTGVTSRTLRHYDDIGLLLPSRIAANGYRHYGERQLRTLQRILLLSELGVGLGVIREIVQRDTTERAALDTHLAVLTAQRDRITEQMRAVEHTVAALEGRGPLVAESMFQGFDHRAHRDEVVERWGTEAANTSSAWWEALSRRDRDEWLRAVETLNSDWRAACSAAEDPAGQVAAGLAARHIAWLSTVPGTPAHDPEGDLAGYVRGLGDMYVADERFAANYGGVEGAAFVRDALNAALDLTHRS